MAVTIYDIAKVVKTSHATVSRALNNHPAISKDTKKNIDRVAKELGYRPNFSATSLKKGKTNKIALLLPDLIDPFFAEFLKDVEQSCLPRNYRVITIQSSLGASYEKSLDEMLEGLCDGAIVFSSSFKKLEDIATQFYQRKMPFIVIGIRSESGVAKVDCIEENVAKGIELAVDHLVELGHREIVFFDNTPSEHEDQSNRVEGLKTAFKKHGLELRPNNVFCFCANLNEEGVIGDKEVVNVKRSNVATNQIKDGLHGIKRLLQIYPQATAIIGTSDLLMLGVMRGLLEMGIRVPDDISLVGTDNCWLSGSLPVSLTSIDMKREFLAHTAVEWFFDQIEKQDWSKRKHAVVSSDLVIGESTAKKREKEFLDIK